MELLYANRSEEDKKFISEVCNDILSIPLEYKPYSEEFAFIYVEGRNRELFIEDIAAFHSCKVFSKNNYPIFAFLHNPKMINQELLDKYCITVIPIRELNSLEEYSKFCINELYFKLPNSINNCITIQPDGFLLCSGWENWLIENNMDLLGAHWQHKTALIISDESGEYIPYPSIYGCNLGFSFRKASKMRQISNLTSNLKMRQVGDINCPEDVYFSYIGFGSKLCKYPTIQECEKFSIDPLNLKIYNSNNRPFGFHFFQKD